VFYVLFISYLFVLIFGACKVSLGFCTPRKRLKHVFELGSLGSPSFLMAYYTLTACFSHFLWQKP